MLGSVFWIKSTEDTIFEVRNSYIENSFSQSPGGSIYLYAKNAYVMFSDNTTVKKSVSN